MVLDAAEAAGRDRSAVQIGTILTIVIDDDQTQGERTLKDFLRRYYQMDATLSQFTDVIGAATGSIAQVAARINEFFDAGAGTVIVRFAESDQDDCVRNLSPVLVEAVAAGGRS